MLYRSCTVLAKYLQGIGIKLLVHCTGAAQELLMSCSHVLLMSSMCTHHVHAHTVCAHIMSSVFTAHDVCMH